MLLCNVAASDEGAAQDIGSPDAGSALMQKRQVHNKAAVHDEDDHPTLPAGTVINPNNADHPCDDDKTPKEQRRPSSKVNLLSRSTRFQATLEGERSEEVQNDFLRELAYSFRDSADKERFNELERELTPMYAALIRNMKGNVNHQAARYALHRLFLQRHRWFIKGLEVPVFEEGFTPPTQGNSTELLNEFLALLDTKSGDDGLSLHELAAFAAALEDLIHREANKRIEKIYEVFNIPLTGNVAPQKAFDIVETYLLIFLTNGNVTINNSAQAMRKVKKVADHIASWNETEEVVVKPTFSKEVGSVTDAKDVNVRAVKRVAEGIGEKFGPYNDKMCHEVRDVLVEMDGSTPGRVPLKEFYRKSLYSTFRFSERVEYLRVLGALDETNSSDMQVIVPNYVASRPNCRMHTSFYSVCCPNECEDLMTRLEARVSAPVADPARIIEIVEEFATTIRHYGANGVHGALRLQLEQIAETHQGLVPLHGREFAEWLHNMFPHNCSHPRTHSEGSQTAEEWLEEVGYDNTEASEQEMVCVVHGTNCAEL
jgi:hypothetical protein